MLKNVLISANNIITGPWSQDFVEPKVQQLWQAALKGDFKPNEIESLRVI